MFRPKVTFNLPADHHLMKRAKNENYSVAGHEPDEILPCHTPIMLPRANTKTLYQRRKMQFKLRQLQQEKVFLKPCKGGDIEKLKKVPRKDLLCSGSGLIEQDIRKINRWIEHGPVDSKLLMKKLDDCYASYGPE